MHLIIAFLELSKKIIIIAFGPQGTATITHIMYYLFLLLTDCIPSQIKWDLESEWVS